MTTVTTRRQHCSFSGLGRRVSAGVSGASVPQGRWIRAGDLMRQGKLVFNPVLLLAHLTHKYQAMDGDISLHSTLQAAQTHHGVAGRTARQAVAGLVVKEGLSHTTIAKIVKADVLCIS